MQPRKKNSAISPVIATIILVAVTLVVALAVGSYVFGLFGASSRGPQVAATAYTLTSSTNPTPNILTVTFSNKGGSAVSVLSASVTIGSATSTNTLVAPGLALLPASSGVQAIFPAAGWTPALSGTHFNGGQSYIFTISFSDGSTQTLVVIAQ